MTIFLARPDPPAAGIRLAVKDLFDTAGLETTYGSAIFAGHVPTETARGGAAARGGGLRERRQDEPARVRLRDDLREPALRRRAEPALSRAASRAGRAAARRPRSRPGSPTRRSAPTRPARSGSPPPAAASSGTSRRHGLVSLDGCWPLAASFDTAGPIAADVDDVPADARGAGARIRARRAGVARGARGRRRLDRPRRAARSASGSRRPRRASRADARSSSRSSRTRPTPSSCARSPTSTASSTPRTPTSTARTCG